MEEAPAADALAGRRCGVLDAEGGRRVGGGRRGRDAGAREAEYAGASDASRRGNPRARGPDDARRDGCRHREKCRDPAGLPVNGEACLRLLKAPVKARATGAIESTRPRFGTPVPSNYALPVYAANSCGGVPIECYFAEFGRSLTGPTAGKLQDFPIGFPREVESGLKIRDPAEISVSI